MKRGKNLPDANAAAGLLPRGIPIVHAAGALYIRSAVMSRITHDIDEEQERATGSVAVAPEMARVIPAVAVNIQPGEIENTAALVYPSFSPHDCGFCQDEKLFFSLFRVECETPIHQCKNDDTDNYPRREYRDIRKTELSDQHCALNSQKFVFCLPQPPSG